MSRPKTVGTCLPMLTENGHVTTTYLLIIIVKSIPQSVSKRRFTPSLSGQGWGRDRMAAWVHLDPLNRLRGLMLPRERSHKTRCHLPRVVYHQRISRSKSRSHFKVRELQRARIGHRMASVYSWRGFISIHFKFQSPRTSEFRRARIGHVTRKTIGNVYGSR